MVAGEGELQVSSTTTMIGLLFLRSVSKKGAQQADVIIRFEWEVGTKDPGKHYVIAFKRDWGDGGRGRSMSQARVKQSITPEEGGEESRLKSAIYLNPAYTAGN